MGPVLGFGGQLHTLICILLNVVETIYISMSPGTATDNVRNWISEIEIIHRRTTPSNAAGVGVRQTFSRQRK
jgi:hypothetical protein